MAKLRGGPKGAKGFGGVKLNTSVSETTTAEKNYISDISPFFKRTHKVHHYVLCICMNTVPTGTEAARSPVCLNPGGPITAR